MKFQKRKSSTLSCVMGLPKLLSAVVAQSMKMLCLKMNLKTNKLP